MFTGIIKEVGRVQSLERRGSLTKLGVKSKIVYQEARSSDSISLNGACLTLIYKENGILIFEAVEPTLKVSNLKRLKRGDFVNLEPSLKVQDKLGGHFVLGHTEAEVKLRRIIKYKDYRRLEIELPASFRKFILENGSVALEGVSLTVKKILPRYFNVDIIPFTYENTNLKYKRAGSWLNIEFDYLLKQVISSKP
ncbi:MAG: riboflavin synthase [Candidatus Omnitrophica bacterium]|nr:riboflavin synthase [Candidatus Omnitrophota bacterium]MBU1133284.1 riboflavin synthase [Candidatus Omnitrophota bacterium]MBU1810220.1 riboflavin synthase [Candidatus Omnitrophota bacterium]